MSQLSTRSRTLQVAFVLLIGIFVSTVGYSQTPRWVLDSRVNTPRGSFAAANVDGSIYISGGNGNPDNRNLRSTEVYDSTTRTWQFGTPNPHNAGNDGFEEVSGIALNGKFYVIGAYGGGVPFGVFNFVEEYDPATDTWTSMASRPVAASTPRLIAYGNEIYAFGGSLGERQNTFLVHAFNPATNSWREVTTIPGNRVWFAAARHESKVLLFGGADSSTVEGDDRTTADLYEEVFAFDLENQTWQTSGITKLPTPRALFHAPAPTLNGLIYCIGGYDISGDQPLVSDVVEIYDPENNHWTTGPAVPPTATNGEAAVVANGTVYLISGQSCATAGCDGQHTTRVIKLSGTLPTQSPASLQLSFNTTSVSPDAGAGAAIGTITRSSIEPLTVSISSSDTGVLTVPATVTIPAYASSATFAVDADSAANVGDGVSVTIEASTNGYTSASESIVVQEQSHHAVYVISVRGAQYGEGAGTLNATGVLLVDLENNRELVMVRFPNRDDYVASWTSTGDWYTADAGSRDYWIITTGNDRTVQTAAAVDTFHYGHLLGAVHPRTLNLGGNARGDIATALSGVWRSGQATESTSVGIATLSARLHAPLTVQANRDNTPWDDLVNDLQNILGIEGVVDAAAAQAEAVDMPQPQNVADHTATVIYGMRYSEAIVGDGSIAQHSYPILLVVDHANGYTLALFYWSANGQWNYAVEPWMAPDSIRYQLPISANGFTFLGHMAAADDTFWLGYGNNSRHALGTATTKTIPFSLTGNTWTHDADAAVYSQASWQGSVWGAQTIAVNQADLGAEAAMQWLIDNVVPAAWQEQDARP